MIDMSKTLQQGKFIADLGLNVGAGITLLESGTGTGKSTWVLQTLTDQNKVLMVVPLVTQAMQLVEKYKGRKDIRVLYGPQKGTSADSLKGKHIVCTYV